MSVSVAEWWVCGYMGLVVVGVWVNVCVYVCLFMRVDLCMSLRCLCRLGCVYVGYVCDMCVGYVTVDSCWWLVSECVSCMCVYVCG